MSTRNGDTDTPLDPSESLAGIAGHFVNARRQGASLPDFPGDIPETLVSAYGGSMFKDAVVYLILIIILIVKPSGIFGKNTKEKV